MSQHSLILNCHQKTSDLKYLSTSFANKTGILREGNGGTKRREGVECEGKGGREGEGTEGKGDIRLEEEVG